MPAPSNAEILDDAGRPKSQTTTEAVAHQGGSTDPILQYFDYNHLPEKLQDVSRRFAELAFWMVDTQPRNAERTVMLRKLLEAKDAAVRCAITQS